MTDNPNNIVLREMIHHMGRRYFQWDYSSRNIFMDMIKPVYRSEPMLGDFVCAEQGVKA